MKLHELDPQEAAHVLTKIKELQASDGWAFLQQIMATEREEFFKKFAEPTSVPMPIGTVHYNRGIIEGTYRLTSLPDKAIATLELLIKMKAQSTQPLTPP